jgi:hypothetical protein
VETFNKTLNRLYFEEVEDVTSKGDNKWTPIAILEGYVYEYNYKKNN